VTCYHPLLAYKSEGKVVFEKPFAFARGFNLPCGQCIGCRLNYSRQWAIRLVHEAQMHEKSCFITLTFNDESLFARENPYSLDKTEYQRFMKRLRKKYGKQVRFFHCGEYGDKNKRPHYHAILFGVDFDHDRKLWSNKDGIKLFTSESLEKLWPYGFCTIGQVTFESCAYVARYIMKKQTGEKAEDHYMRWCPETGEGTAIDPEYCTMSRKPGIGKSWIEKYKTDVYPHDYVVINEHKVKPPRFYDQQLDEDELRKLKDQRIKEADDPIKDYGPEMDRLWVSQEIKIKKFERLIRNL
jgi:hypothetical protein